MADKAFMSFTQNGETLAGGHSLLVGGSTMEYRALVNDVAKFIMENYDGSTLAGAAQTPKTALDALDAKAQQFSVAGNSNISLGLSDRFTIIAWAYATTSCGLDFIFVSSNTLRRIKMVSGANEPTYEIADGKIKVINSGSSYVRGMMIYGKIFN